MSMLRNVLTYMGLGPDEDYDEGYLSDVDDTDIDLTDDHDHDEEPERRERPSRSVDPAREDRRSSRRTVRAIEEPADARARPDRPDRSSAPTPPSSTVADPHAQRERPGWLTGPSSPPERRAAQGRQQERSRHRPPTPDGPRQDQPEAADTIAPRRGAHDLLNTERERPLRAVPPSERSDDDLGQGDGVTVQPAAPPAAREQTDTAPPAEPEIRLVPPRTLAPGSFGDAKELADEFKAQVPVVMDLQAVDRELARRLIDFASGICYALDGSMEKIASQVFLLIPVGVDVSDDERRRLEEKRPTDRS